MPIPSDPNAEAKLAELWDQVRKKFATSIMVETKLASLAVNAEAEEWPLDGDDETPSKYIDFNYHELKMLPEFAIDPSRIHLLIDILHETLSFDDPFGDMAETIEASAAAGDNTVRKVLKDLGIPEDYPVQLTALSDDAIELCKAEGIETLGQFADFAQNMAQNVIIGGDFRALVNALGTGDEEALAKYLPFRPKTNGLHVPEAFGMIIRALTPDQIFGLAVRAGKRASAEETARHKPLNTTEIAQLETRLQNRIGPVLLWFNEQREDLNRRISAGEKLDRYFLVLNNPDVELVAMRLVGLMFKGKAVTAAPSASPTPAPAAKKEGLFSKLGRMFKH